MQDDVCKIRTGYEWPDGRPFPLTPEEAYWIIRGWLVLPASQPDVTHLHEMPGRLEMLNGYIALTH